MLHLPTWKFDKRGVFLSDINRWLPHEWFSTESAHIVAKNDDSTVPLQFWNGRILTIFLHITNNTINILHKFIHKWYCKRLYLNFQEFMNSSHAKSLAKILQEHRGDLTSSTSLGPTSSTSSGLTSGLASSTNKELQSFELLKLQGIQALEKGFNSTAFEWNKGSTLFLCFKRNR